MDQTEKQPVKIYGNEPLSARVAAFSKKVEEQDKKKKQNTFLQGLNQRKWDGPMEAVPMDLSEKQPVKIYGNDPLSARVAAFSKKAEEHGKKQKRNPFTQGLSGVDQPKWDKSDPRYGRPVEGSKTEKRGLAAGAHIGGEVQFLCEMISEYGIPCEDGTTVISFGELFNIYVTISNKVVGILLRARKHGLVHFEGEILYQRRDEDVMITLLKPMQELREMWGIKTATKRKHEDNEEPMVLSPEDY